MFVHFLPGEYCNRRWPTRDGVIPWKLFAIRSPMVFAVMAQERLQVARGIGLALADKQHGPSLREREWKEAFPSGRLNGRT